MKSLNKVPIKDKDLAWRIIEEETIVIPLSHETNNKEKMYILNETATKIWSFINGKNTVKDISKKLLEEYYIDPQKALYQVNKIIDNMSRKKIIAISRKGGV